MHVVVFLPRWASAVNLVFRELLSSHHQTLRYGFAIPQVAWENVGIHDL